MEKKNKKITQGVWRKIQLAKVSPNNILDSSWAKSKKAGPILTMVSTFPLVIGVGEAETGEWETGNS